MHKTIIMNKTKYITSTKPNKIKETDLITVILVYHSFVKRMKAFGNVAMIPISQNEKLIDRHIRQIKRQIKNYEIIISLGYDANKVQNYIYKRYRKENVRCIENTRYEVSGVCESLRLAINNTHNDKILIINGNIVYEEKILDKIISSQSITALSGKQFNQTLDIGANIDEDTGSIAQVSYGPINNRWSEIIYLNKAALINEAKKFLAQKDFQNKIMYELMNSMIKRNINIKYVDVTENITKITNTQNDKRL